MTAPLMAILAVAGACGGDGGGLPDPPAPTSAEVSPNRAPGPGLTSAERQAVDEVADTLDAYLEVFTELGVDGVDVLSDELQSAGARLGQYRRGAQGGYDLVVLHNHYVDGHRFAGSLDWELVEVVNVDLERRVRGETVPEVTIRICVDESRWTTVDAETGDVVDGPGTRHLATVAASYSSDDDSALRPGPAWRLGRWEDDRSRSC